MRSRLRLLHRRLVERPVPGDHLLADPDDDVEGQPLLDRVAAVDDVPDGVRQRLRLGLGEEADAAEVDAEQRRRAGRASSAARRNVPSPPSTSTTSQPAAADSSGGTALTSMTPRSAASSSSIRTWKPADSSSSLTCAGPVDHVPPAGVRDQQRVPAHLPLLERTRPRPSPAQLRRSPLALRALALAHGPTTVASRPGPPAARRGAARGRTRRCPPGPAAGCAITPAQPQPELVRRGRDTSRTASARSAGSRTTPPAPTRSRPTSNCGLTIGSRSPSGRAGGQRRQHQRAAR